MKRELDASAMESARKLVGMMSARQQLSLVADMLPGAAAAQQLAEQLRRNDVKPLAVDLLRAMDIDEAIVMARYAILALNSVNETVALRATNILAAHLGLLVPGEGDGGKADSKSEEGDKRRQASADALQRYAAEARRREHAD